MALDVYFREDVQNILWATLAASEGSAALTERNALTEAYRRGFEDALRAVALGFGLGGPLPSLRLSPDAALGGGE